MHQTATVKNHVTCHMTNRCGSCIRSHTAHFLKKKQPSSLFCYKNDLKSLEENKIKYWKNLVSCVNFVKKDNYWMHEFAVNIYCTYLYFGKDNREIETGYCYFDQSCWTILNNISVCQRQHLHKPIAFNCPLWKIYLHIQHKRIYICGIIFISASIAKILIDYK